MVNERRPIASQRTRRPLREAEDQRVWDHGRTLVDSAYDTASTAAATATAEDDRTRATRVAAVDTLHTEHAMTKPSEASVKTLRAESEEQAVELGSGRREWLGDKKQQDARYSQDHYRRQPLEDWMNSDEW